MKRKNVLVSGIGQTNYLFQLYGNIAPRLEQFCFNSINLKKFGDSDIENRAKQIFEENYRYKFKFHDIFQILESCFAIISTKYFWKDHRISIAEIGWKHLKYAYYLSKKHISAYHYAKFIDKETKTDIIHLHYPSHGNNLFLGYLNRNYILIQTFWGSDIYRIKSWLTHEIQKETLKKTDIITTATPEMKFAVEIRYGFELSEKIRKVKFIHDNRYYEVADKLLREKNWIPEFEKSLNIKEGNIIILYGHNGHEQNNHIKFIHQLKSLPANILLNFHVIFPLSYGPSNTYINKIKESTVDIACKFTFLTDFMEWDYLAKLKIYSDVYIHAPTTDGLSAFLTEFLYTNNLAIVGNWLPYKAFTDINLSYLEFERFDDLKEILIDLPNHISNFKNHKGINRSIVSENFSVKKISDDWLNIYNELEN